METVGTVYPKGRDLEFSKAKLLVNFLYSSFVKMEQKRVLQPRYTPGAKGVKILMWLFYFFEAPNVKKTIAFYLFLVFQSS